LCKTSTGFFALFAFVLVAGLDGNFCVALLAFVRHIAANDRLGLFFWANPGFRVAFGHEAVVL